MKYLYESLYLDYVFLFKVKLNILYKIGFVFLKYLLLVKNVIVFNYGKSSIKVFGKRFYYPNIYGLVSIQRVFADNYFLKENLRNCETVIDIGAHVGEFNIFAKKYLGAKTVHSFEPMKKSYSLLQKNVNQNNAYNYAIYTDKSANLHISSISTQLNSIKNQNGSDYTESETVNCVVLDEFLAVNKDTVYDLLKIDVEGAEFEVISTAQKIIQRCRYLIIEMSVDRAGSENFMTIISHMHENHPYLEIAALNNYHTGARSIDILFHNNSI
ncbi:MAG: FkbM family methyltransferase [Candidatus Moranbacteria bacterium]|nr:FkbM family methyltransferase [Candidatus Moranbacteria bacterium]